LKSAAAKGTGEVGYAIISSTITTLLSFFPLTQLGGGAGEFLKTLPVTVILTLLVSLVLALTLSPILASRLLKVRQSDRPRFVSRVLKGITEKIYRPVLAFSLKRGWLILLAAIGLTAFSISLFWRYEYRNHRPSSPICRVCSGYDALCKGLLRKCRQLQPTSILQPNGS